MANISRIAQITYGNPSTIKWVDLLANTGSTSQSERWMFSSVGLSAPINSYTTVSSTQYGTSSTWSKTPDYPTHRYQLYFSNWWTINTGAGTGNASSGPEFDNTNPIRVRASVSFDLGSTWTQLTFTGSNEAVIAAGASVASDTLTLTTPVTSCPVLIRTYRGVDTVGYVSPGGYRSGTYVPGPPNNDLLGCYYSATQSACLALLNGGTLTDNGFGGAAYYYGPSLMVAKDWDGRGVALIVGDSIGALNQWMGWTTRGIEDTSLGKLRLPLANLCVPGTKPSNQAGAVQGAYLRKSQLLGMVTSANGGLLPFTSILSEMCVNSMTANGNDTAILGIMRTWWQFLTSQFPGAPITQTYPTPKTQSTTSDSSWWTNYTGQQPIVDDRWTLSADLPAQITAGYISHLVDATTAWTNEAAWNNTPPYGWEIVPSSTFNATVTSPYTAGDKVIYLSAAPQLGTGLVPAGLTSNPAGVVGSVTGSGPYAVQTAVNSPAVWFASQSFTVGTTVLESPTLDGLHPQEPLESAAVSIVSAGKSAGYFGVASFPPTAQVESVAFQYGPTNVTSVSVAGPLTRTDRLIHKVLATGTGLTARYINDSATETITIVGAEFYDASGTNHAVSFSGQVGATIAPRSFVDIDPMPTFQLPAVGSYLNEQTCVSISDSGVIVLGNHNFSGTNKGGTTTGNSLGTLVPVATGAYLFGAVKVGCQNPSVALKQVAVSTDSWGETWPALMWEGYVPVIMMSRSGESAVQASASGRLGEILAGIAGAHVVWEAYGINDLLSHPTLATIQSARLTLWNGYRNNGQRIIVGTLAAHTDSTDQYMTLANQTLSALLNTSDENNRQALNAWLRDGAPLDINAGVNNPAIAATGSSGSNVVRAGYNNTAGGDSRHPVYTIFDQGSIVEAQGSTGKWMTYWEGTLTTQTGANANVATISSTTGGSSSPQVGMYLAAASGSGLPQSSAAKNNLITAVSGSQVTMTSSATAAGTWAAGCPSTFDGLHPSNTYTEQQIISQFPTAVLL